MMERELPTLAETLATYTPSAALRTAVEALAATLSPDQELLLAQVIAGTWEEAAEARQQELEAEREAIIKHFPGLAPAWDVVSAHVEDQLAHCAEQYRDAHDRLRTRCTLDERERP